MTREHRRLLISPERLGVVGNRQLVLEDSELHYLGRVLRLRAGDGFAVVDGVGRLWSAKLMAGGTAELEQPLEAPLQQEARPRVRLALLVAWPKRDGELLLRMACELGVDQIRPVAAERRVASQNAFEKFNQHRCSKILREAAEQSERLWLPELFPLQAAGALFGAAPSGLALLATTRLGELPLLKDVLATQRIELGAGQPPGSAMVSVAVGPEGGWSPAEEALALAKGWQPVSLGPTILRTGTAAVAVAALLGHWRAGI